MISLRQFYFACAILMATSSLSAAAALAISGWRLNQSSQALAMALERVEAAKSMRGNLAQLRRQGLLRRLRVAPEREGREAAVRAALERDLEHAEAADRSESGMRRSRETRAALEHYLAVYGRARAAGLDGGELYSATFEAAEAFSQSLERIAEANAAQGRLERDAALGESREAGVLSIAVACFVLGASIFMAWAARRIVALPLWRLRERIERYRLGAAASDVGDLPAVDGAEDIRAIAAAFDVLRERLESQRERQLTSLASVAHDIKNPIGAIQMCASVLAEVGLSEPERIDAASIVSRQAEHLDRLVADVLDDARIEAGQIALRPRALDLRGIARESVELFRRASPEHEIVFEEGLEAVPVEGDAERLTQVLGNLLSNALKYSPSGGRVVVSCRRDARARIAELAVADDGIGLAADELEAVFEPYRRADAARDGFAGVGLGLSTCKRIVEAHGGAIEATSEGDGKGTKFTAKFPLAALDANVETLRDGLEEGPRPRPPFKRSLSAGLGPDERSFF